MKILVTGGLGFIGSNFVRYLLNNYSDIEVINLDSMSIGSNIDNLKDVSNNARYKFVKGSITDYDLITKLIKDVDAIVNFAAETHVDRSISNPKPFLDSNVYGVFTILEAIRKNRPDIKFVHISTDEVYGEIIDGSFTEESRLKPSNPYSATKASADMLVLAYQRTYKLNAVITRSSNNFGPYQFPEKLIPKTIIRAMHRMKIPVYGTGKNVRDWIYVVDNCRAVDYVMTKSEPGEIYNISAGNEVENIVLVKKILGIMGLEEDLIEFVEDRPGHDLRYSIDSSKIRDELGWRPKYSLDEALRETVEWYVNNRWWWEPLISEKVLHPTPWKLEW